MNYFFLIKIFFCIFAKNKRGMNIKHLRTLIRAKNLLVFVKHILIYAFETIVCFACYSFLASIICIVIYFACKIYRENEVIRYYTLGILTTMSVILSIVYISKYNKKYLKNDSDSSKRQNDLFFESDIRRQEERYFDRRNVE